MTTTTKRNPPKTLVFAPKKRAADDRAISLRLDRALTETLDALARGHETTRTEVIERLLLWALERCSDQLGLGATRASGHE